MDNLVQHCAVFDALGIRTKDPPAEHRAVNELDSAPGFGREEEVRGRGEEV